MQQTICPNLLTVVDNFYINDKDGENPKMFQAQEQYTFIQKFIPPIIIIGPGQTKPCTCSEEVYSVICNEHEYWLPSSKVVETQTVIDPQHRDFEKDRNEFILMPNSGEEPGTDFHPDPCTIRNRANICRM